MQIGSLLPLLIEIFTRQAGQNKVNRELPGQEAGKAARQEAGRPSPAVSAETGRTGGEEVQAARLPSPGHDLPDFLPLPIKSPLFSESAFFIKSRQENQAPEGEDGRAWVFIRLRTENLGLIWISLAAGNQSLKVSFYTESETFTETIRETLPALVDELQKLGYPSVSAAGITRPGIRDCSDIAPGSKVPGTYLLDLEV